MNNSFTCEQARQIDLVEFLSTLGHSPVKSINNDYWFFSPFRRERTPSFKINKVKNVWFDFGVGKGGDLIEFGILYFNCTISNLLQRLSHQAQHHPSFFHPQTSNIQTNSFRTNHSEESKKDEFRESKITIIDKRKIAFDPLLQYLKKRKIPLSIAKKYCVEIDFILYNKKHTVIGFENKDGGFELRSENFKGSSSPKAITFINYQQEEISVFEGFFNFLSFQNIVQINPGLMSQCGELKTNFIVLNSLSFLEKSRDILGKYNKINLFLDRDKAGIQATQKTLQWPGNIKDFSHLYKEYKDLNEFSLNNEHQKQKSNLIKKRSV